jgi:hypothetical protein
VIAFRDGEVDVPGMVRELKRIVEEAERLEPHLAGAEPGFSALLATFRRASGRLELKIQRNLG